MSVFFERIRTVSGQSGPGGSWLSRAVRSLHAGLCLARLWDFCMAQDAPDVPAVGHPHARLLPLLRRHPNLYHKAVQQVVPSMSFDYLKITPSGCA